ncbi:hypothetical protein CB1_000897012 [Camelus ferus]|nr:hypothetical protein CB1_000897012 [Camelus ferus]
MLEHNPATSLSSCNVRPAWRHREDTVSASHLQDDALHLAVLKSPGPQRFSSPSLSGESSDAAQRYRSVRGAAPVEAAAWRPGSLVRQVFQTVYVQSTMDFRGRAILERPSTFTHHLSLHKKASSIQEFAINLWQLCMDGLRFLLLGLRPLIPEEGSQHLEDLWNTLWVMGSDHIITLDMVLQYIV